MTTAKAPITAPSDPGGYTPREHAIICAWLGIRPPAFARDVNVWGDIDCLERDADRPLRQRHRELRLRPSASGGLTPDALSDAVARLVLQPVQRRLPQIAVVHPDRVEFGRRIEPVPGRSVTPLTHLLFEITWESAAAGFCWPSTYAAGYLPGYEIRVITESSDTDDSFGYCDRTIGWFPASIPVLQGAHDVIVPQWDAMQSELQQARWESVFAPGLVSGQLAAAWADEVWSEAVNDSPTVGQARMIGAQSAAPRYGVSKKQLLHAIETLPNFDRRVILIIRTEQIDWLHWTEPDTFAQLQAELRLQMAMDNAISARWGDEPR